MGIDTPISEAELEEWETRARANGDAAGEPLLRLIAELRRLRAREQSDSWIERRPEKCGGAPTIRGTQIAVHHVVAQAKRLNWDLERVHREEMPHVPLEQLQAALEYYRSHEAEIEAILSREREAYERLAAGAVR